MFSTTSSHITQFKHALQDVTNRFVNDTTRTSTVSSAYNDKTNQKQSLEFLSKQTKRLSQIESQLFELSQLVTLEKKHITSAHSNNNNKKKKTNPNVQVGQEQSSTISKDKIMSMNELSSLCNMLHSHHAKYLLQIEETLNNYYGYQLSKTKLKMKESVLSSTLSSTSPSTTTASTASRSDYPSSTHDYDNFYDTTDKKDHQNTSNNNNHNNQDDNNTSASSLPSSTPSHSNHHHAKNFNTNDHSILSLNNTIIGQPLSRLSEGEIETDVGSSATSYSNSSSGGSSRRSSSSKINHTSNNMRGRRSSSRSSTSSSTTMTTNKTATLFVSPPPSNKKTIEDSIHNHDHHNTIYTPSPPSSSRLSCSSSPITPITPSLASLKLRYVPYLQ